MKTIIPAVLSADGKMTKGGNGDSFSWSSPEDSTYFKQLRSEHRVLVMGRTTYETIRPQPDPEHLRLVLTSTPEKFQSQAVPDQLEFANLSPADAIAALESRGHSSALLLGGRSVHTGFLLAGLVSEVHLTIEPRLFGQGLSLLGEGDLLDVQMRLEEMRCLNDMGTVLLRYAVIN